MPAKQSLLLLCDELIETRRKLNINKLYAADVFIEIIIEILMRRKKEGKKEDKKGQHDTIICSHGRIEVLLT